MGTPNDTCDAVSVALTFTSDVGKLGVVGPPPKVKPNPCPNGNDPAMDTCK